MDRARIHEGVLRIAFWMCLVGRNDLNRARSHEHLTKRHGYTTTRWLHGDQAASASSGLGDASDDALGAWQEVASDGGNDAARDTHCGNRQVPIRNLPTQFQRSR